MAVKTKRRRDEEELEDMELELDDDDEEIEEEEERPRKKKKRPSAEDESTTSHDRLIRRAVKKIKSIRQEMNQVLLEREDVIDDLLRALIAKENVLLLGPPGTAKSMLAEMFSRHVSNASLFKWLMNRTTDPSDIFGPYSIKQMENDKFMRITTGRAPEAHFWFLDEIFKANEPVLNAMLTALNEGIFYNDGKAIPVERRLAIGASNEFPEVEDLNAFFDRFIFRHWVPYIRDPQNRIFMARAARELRDPNSVSNLTPPTVLTLDEIDALHEQTKLITFSTSMENTYDKLIRSLQNSAIALEISDRRYVKGQLAMQANAVLSGRDKVTTDDFKALVHILWNRDPKELEIVRTEVEKFLNPYESKVKELLKKAEEVKTKCLGLSTPTERAAEAVQANVTLQEVLGKIEKEIKEADKNGMDITPLENMRQQVEDYMEEIAQTCLRQSIRGSRKF